MARTSIGLPGVTRSYVSFDEAAREAGQSRIYGGIHFPFSNEDGRMLGDQLADFVLGTFSKATDTQPPRIVVESPQDGAVVRNEVSYPYDLSTLLPRIGPGGNQAILQVRATDTGGNAALSDPIVIDLLPDNTPPSITSIDPADASTQPVSRRQVTLHFSEPLDSATAVLGSFELLGPAGTVAPISLRLGDHGATVVLYYPPLAEGDYQIVVHAASVTDRAGSGFVSGFVSDATITANREDILTITQVTNRATIQANPGSFVQLSYSVNESTINAAQAYVALVGLHNAGTIEASQTTIVFGSGTLLTADLGTIHNPGGTVLLGDGFTLDNTGSTLVIDATPGGDWQMDDATIVRGTIQVAPGSRLWAQSLAALRDLTVQGDVQVGELLLQGDLTFQGTVDASQSFVRGLFLGDVTFGPGVVLHGGHVTASFAQPFLNQGTILADGGPSFAGDRFALLTYASHTGTFDTITPQNLPAGLVVTPEYNADNMTLVVSAALRAAALSSTQAARMEPLASHAPQTLIDAAIARWAAAGASQTDLDRMGHVELRVTDLDHTLLGLANPDTITLDIDAARSGAFIAPTPLQEEKFLDLFAQDVLRANRNTGAASRTDLLTVMLHETGHVAGLEHADSGIVESLMSATLDAGLRRLPEGAPTAAD